MLTPLYQAGRGSLKRLRRLMKLFFQLLVIGRHIAARHCLDPAHACRNTGFRQDLEGTDHAGSFHMGAPTQLLRELSHLYNSYRIAVFLTKQRHCAGLLRLFDRHFFRLDH